ncbi:HAD family hydrolase [Neptunicella sp. SCSIO 80796]|uniref:HAD family hydrolase n=1 Tax=Neptunicella plasticusilytica TaxID=3117012 RepID=UPI003A4D4C5A
MLDLSKYQGIVFDMDGTLIDSMGAHMRAWQQACEAFGIPFDHDYMHGLGGVPTKKTAEILNDKYQLNHSPEEVASRKRDFWIAMGESPAIIEETVNVLKHYRGKLKIGIGTGAERPHAEKMLQDTGLLDMVETLVTATDVTHGKPHPETFLTVARNMGIEPQYCVVFEDTQIGAEAASRAGMDCILVQDGRINAQGFSRLPV